MPELARVCPACFGASGIPYGCKNAWHRAIRDEVDPNLAAAWSKLGQLQSVMDKCRAEIELGKAENARLLARLTEVEGERDEVAVEYQRVLGELLAQGPVIERLEREQGEARADAERMRLVLAIQGGGVDPNGRYAGTPGSRLRDLLLAEQERDNLAAENARLRQPAHSDSPTASTCAPNTSAKPA